MNNPPCPYIFIKESEIISAIIDVYIDDLNLVGTLEELTIIENYLKMEFEMKDFGKPKILCWPTNQIFPYWSF